MTASRTTAAAALPAALVADLRTDHAGETGAVMIYRGILAASRDPALRAFAKRHLATETDHLARIDPWLAPRQRSRLLPIWRLAGWLTGALPALVGPRVVYSTVEAVETFVDQHYGDQIHTIDGLDPGRSDERLQSLRALLAGCRADEVAHRDEAAALSTRAQGAPSAALRAWLHSVGKGSQMAVHVCRVI